MADMNMPQKGGRRKVQAPRIDLTPMVDLGFLLITFFMFTTSLARQKALPLNMPSTESTDKPQVVPAESTLTLIAIQGHSILYYEGAFERDKQIKQCAVSGVVDLILKKKAAIAMLPASFSKEAHKLHVLLKPENGSKYDDLVQLLDAMLIADVPYYAIVDVTTEEEAAMKRR